MSREGMEGLRARVHADPDAAARLAAEPDGELLDAILSLAATSELEVSAADVRDALAAGRHAWIMRWLR